MTEYIEGVHLKEPKFYDQELVEYTPNDKNSPIWIDGNILKVRINPAKILNLNIKHLLGHQKENIKSIVTKTLPSITNFSRVVLLTKIDCRKAEFSTLAGKMNIRTRGSCSISLSCGVHSYSWSIPKGKSILDLCGLIFKGNEIVINISSVDKNSIVFSSNNAFKVVHEYK